METTVNNTMVKIQTVTVGAGGASSIDFNTISNTYTDLYIVTSLRTGDSGVALDINIKFNNSDLNKTIIYFDGTGSSYRSGSYAYTSVAATGTTATASAFGISHIYIPNYASTTYNKSFSIDYAPENNGTTNYWGFKGGYWANTAAINQVTLFGNFVQYSTATLYGITATPNTTKASGGIIYQDATYMYHVFPYSSTFTPSTSLSCDVLCIAGGASGGYDGGGGGGAGGVIYFASESLTATGYSVSIGAGGAGGGTSGNAGSNSTFGSLTAAVGGGKGGNGSSNTAGSGGSGGGGGANGSQSGASSTQTGTGATAYYGNAGGNGNTSASGGGGGGAGAAGATGGTGGTGGAGGIGTSVYSSWAIATSTGIISSGTGYYAGGGGGGTGYGVAGGNGGIGGGGTGGGPNTTAPIAGIVNTGGGGGGGNGNPATPASGGSGLVIIRYAK